MAAPAKRQRRARRWRRESARDGGASCYNLLNLMGNSILPTLAGLHNRPPLPAVRRGRRARRAFWSAHQRFGSLLRLSFPAPRPEAAGGPRARHPDRHTARSEVPRAPLTHVLARDLQHAHPQEGTLRPARPRQGRALRLRADGLRLHPRRQRAHLLGLRPRRALAARERLRRHLRAQHHGRRRQDHGARPQPGRADRGAHRAHRRRVRRGLRAPEPARARQRAARHALHRPDAGAHRGARERRGSPTAAPTATCTSRCATSRATASSRAGTSTTCAPASAWRSRPPSATRSTSSSGRRPSPASRRGRRRSARAGPAGTSSARPCPAGSWARRSTSTAAAGTCSSRTTRTRSRRAKGPTRSRS